MRSFNDPVFQALCFVLARDYRDAVDLARRVLGDVRILGVARVVTRLDFGSS